MIVGTALCGWAAFIDANALGNGPVDNPFGRLLAFFGFAFLIGLGLGPLLNRLFWRITKMKHNEYHLARWKERCDGPNGKALIWLAGVDREGELTK